MTIISKKPRLRISSAKPTIDLRKKAQEEDELDDSSKESVQDKDKDKENEIITSIFSLGNLNKIFTLLPINPYFKQEGKDCILLWLGGDVPLRTDDCSVNDSSEDEGMHYDVICEFIMDYAFNKDNRRIYNEETQENTKVFQKVFKVPYKGSIIIVQKDGYFRFTAEPTRNSQISYQIHDDDRHNIDDSEVKYRNSDIFKSNVMNKLKFDKNLYINSELVGFVLEAAYITALNGNKYFVVNGKELKLSLKYCIKPNTHRHEKKKNFDEHGNYLVEENEQEEEDEQDINIEEQQQQQHSIYEYSLNDFIIDDIDTSDWTIKDFKSIGIDKKENEIELGNEEDIARKQLRDRIMYATSKEELPQEFKDNCYKPPSLLIKNTFQASFDARRKQDQSKAKIEFINALINNLQTQKSTQRNLF